MDKPVMQGETDIRCGDCDYLMIRCGGNSRMILQPPTIITCTKCGLEHKFVVPKEYENRT